MKILTIIPARMASSRFPGKPLKLINKKPMLFHVYKRAEMFFKKEDLFIATCDSQIMNFSESIEANCIMTSKKHLTTIECFKGIIFLNMKCPKSLN